MSWRWMAALLVVAACETNSQPGAQPTDTGPNTGLQFRDTAPGPDAVDHPDPGGEDLEDVPPAPPDEGPGGEDVPDASDPPDPGAPDPGPPVGCQGEGTSCNDGDPCTVNDQCSAGTCAGTPVTCDDGLPCTDNQCNQGVCEYPVSAGSCLIGGICYSDGDPNPQNTCQRCVAGTPKSWSTAAGPCDDNDPCTTGDTCGAGGCVGGPLLDGDTDGAPSLACGGTDCDDTNQQVTPGKAEVCDDGLDNDCNGLTDQADDGCTTPNAPCTYHVDCDQDEVCARWGTSGEYRCSETCGGPAECPAGQTCSKLSGGAIGYCQPHLGPKAGGAACTTAAECQSGICLGVCLDACMNEKNCTKPGHTCAYVNIEFVGLRSICFPDQPALKLNGQPCTMWSEEHQQEIYTGDACMSGLCDLSGPTAAYWTCTPLCTSESQCAPSQECNFMLYNPIASPDAAYLSADKEGIPLLDAQTGCYTSLAGPLPDGAVCSQHSDCQNGRCTQLFEATPAKYCTSYCLTDADCGPTLTCAAMPFNLTSSYLADAEVGAQEPLAKSFSMVKVCIP